MSLDFVGSPNFDSRPQSSRRSNGGGPRSRQSSRASSFDTRLPIIDEDHPSPPLPLPPRTHNRPFSRRFLGEPPRYSNGHEPPKYTFFDVKGPKGEKFEDLRNNAYIAQRGGWKRICIISLVLLVVIVALAVGLGVGLGMGMMHNNNSSAPPAPAASSSALAKSGPFPAGSYTLTTFLDTSSTNCTSNPDSWKCEPAVTYASDPTGSEASFNWIITASNANPSQFTISSTNNPFAIDFQNASLNLLDAGTATERYTFTTTVKKAVFPSFNVKCYYNDTQFMANMYTKKPKSYPSGAAATSGTSTANAPAATSGTPAGGDFANWDYAVDATQSIGGGEDVPDCYEYNGGQVGAKVTRGYTVRPAQDFCACAYKNHDPSR